MRSLFPKILLAAVLSLLAISSALALAAAGMLLPGMRAVDYGLPVLASAAVLIIVVISVLLSRHITSPLLELRHDAAAIASGHLSARVSPRLRDRQDEIGQLGRDFDRMAERVEALVASQTQLLWDVSHELRSPLTRLSVAVGLARKAATPESAEIVNRIALEAGRLDELIGQLLTLSRVESATETIAAAAVDLTALVEEVAADADYEARARSKRVSVLRADPCTVSGSGDLLRSAVENVVRNAVRHAPVNTTVTVSVRLDGARALVRVEDQGAGVPDDLLPHIFQPFRRGPGGNEDRGAGLGLAIAKRALESHGGRIGARNAAAGGLIVEIELPDMGPSAVA